MTARRRSNGKPVLVSPDEAYSLQTALGSVLLVDGRGQIDDIGYPMSIPQKRWMGERIDRVQWDERCGCGQVTLNLQPAYPADLDVVQYTRIFLLGPDRKIVVRDHVVVSEPRTLSWLFQTRRKDSLVVDTDLRSRVQSDPPLTLTPQILGAEFTATIHDTAVVWAYGSHNDWGPFDHLRYDTVSPITAVTVDFVLTW